MDKTPTGNEKIKSKSRGDQGGTRGTQGEKKRDGTNETGLCPTIKGSPKFKGKFKIIKKNIDIVYAPAIMEEIGNHMEGATCQEERSALEGR